MKKNRKNKNAPPPGLPPDEKPPIEEQPKKQPFLKRLLFGEETPDLSELEAGSTTILDILSPTSVDTKSRDYIVVDGIFHAYLYITGYSQTRSNTQRDLMNPDEVLRLENRKCLALFKGHKPALLYKMTPEELPDYAGLTTCRVIDYIPEWRRKEAETAPQKRPQAPAQKEPSNIPKPPVKEKQPDHSEQPPACDLAEDDEIGMVECTVESIRGL